MKEIDADYYGYRDDDDGILLPLEQKDEQEHRQVLIDEWKPKEAVVPKETVQNDNDEETPQMHIPSQTEIQNALLLRKKQELLQKYVD